MSIAEISTVTRWGLAATIALAVAISSSVAQAETWWVPPPTPTSRSKATPDYPAVHQQIVRAVQARRPEGKIISDVVPSCPTGREGAHCLVRTLIERNIDYLVQVIVHDIPSGRRFIWVRITSKDDVLYVRQAHGDELRGAAQKALHAALDDAERGPGPWVNFFGPVPGLEVQVQGRSVCRLPCLAKLQPGTHDVTIRAQNGAIVESRRIWVSHWGLAQEQVVGAEDALSAWHKADRPEVLVALPTEVAPRYELISKAPVVESEAIAPIENLPADQWPLAWLNRPSEVVSDNEVNEPPVAALRPREQVRAPSIAGPAVLASLAVASFTYGAVALANSSNSNAAVALTVGSLCALGSMTWWIRARSAGRGAGLDVGLAPTKAAVRMRF